MSNHTPGPWRIVPVGVHGGADIRDGGTYGTTIAYMIPHAGIAPKIDDARLIAAAPMLAEALEEARDALFSGAPVTVGLENLINNALRLAKTGRMFDQ